MVTTTTGLATSFITFSRPGASGGGATVTDRDGRIKWAGHNLLTNSESFDNATSWPKSNATVAANAEVAPNNTTTADTITTSSTSHIVVQQITVTPGASYTLAFFAKRGTMTDAKLSLYDNTNSADIVAPTSYYASINASTWTLVTQSFTAPAGCTSVNVYPLRNSGVTGTIHLWGAHLYRSDMQMQLNPAMPAGMQSYYPTTPRNALGWTEDFSNAAWTKTGVLAFGSGSVSNATVAPNGLQAADLLIENTANSTHEVNATYASITNTPYTFSVYAKAAGRNWCVVTTGVAGAWFNLSSGTVGTTQAGCTATISSVGNGWFLCRATVTETSGSGTRTPRIYIANADNVVTYTGDGVSGIYLWGAQLSDSASLDTYVPVYGAAVSSAAYYAPRLDFDGATLSPKGLLVEEQRVNLFQQSNGFGTSPWYTGFGTLTVTAAAGVSPDGNTNAFSIANATGSAAGLTQNHSATSGVAYTFSVWLRCASGTVAAQINAANGTPSNITVTTTWQRFSVTTTASTTATVQNTITVPANSTVLAYGAQLEAGSFATSYIPNGSAVAGATRAADVASVSTSAFPYSSSEGTLVVNASSPCIADIANMLTLDNGTLQERIRLLTDITSVKTIVTQSNTTQANLSPGTVTANTPFRFAVAFKANDFAAVVNGSAAATDTSGTVPVANVARLGADSVGSYLNGHIRQITYLPRRISNAELQSRTA